MEEKSWNKLKDNLDMLEKLFSKVEVVRNIEDIFGKISLENSASLVLNAVEILYGEEISDSIGGILSAPYSSLKILDENKYENDLSIRLFILKFSNSFMRLRQIEETGPTTLMKISEVRSDNKFIYTIQRADNTYFDIRVSQENQLGLINYFIKLLSNHIEDSTNLDMDDLEDFYEDLKITEKSIRILGENIEKKIEELNNGAS